MRDLISRQATIDMIEKYFNGLPIAVHYDMIAMIHRLPSAQPETATVTIGRTKGSVTMWYECDACGEPIDICDCYCRKCGRKLKHE